MQSLEVISLIFSALRDEQYYSRILIFLLLASRSIFAPKGNVKVGRQCPQIKLLIVGFLMVK